MPSVYSNGLPFDENGRLHVEEAPPAYYSQGIPFTASGAVAVTSDNAGGHFDQGLEFGAQGALYVSDGLAPAVSNVLMVARGTSGLESWDMGATPYTQVTAVDPLPEANIYGVDYNQATQRLALGGTQIYIYDTSTFPYTLIQTVALDGDPYKVVRFAPDGSTLFASPDGSAGVGTYLINTADWSSVVLSAGDGADSANYEGDSDVLIYMRVAGAGNGYKAFDVTNPAAPIALDYPFDGSTFYRGTAIHRPHNYLLTRFTGNNDIYAINLAAQTFIGVFDNLLSVGLQCVPDGSRYIQLSQSAPGLEVYDSVSSSTASWTLLSLAAGAGLSGSASASQRGALEVSADSRYCCAFQTNDATDENRIVWDLSTNPIERVPAFGGTGGSNFSAMAFVIPPP